MVPLVNEPVDVFTFTLSPDFINDTSWSRDASAWGGGREGGEGGVVFHLSEVRTNTHHKRSIVRL